MTDTPQVVWARWFCGEIVAAFRHIGKVEMRVVCREGAAA